MGKARKLPGLGIFLLLFNVIHKIVKLRYIFQKSDKKVLCPVLKTDVPTPKIYFVGAGTSKAQGTW